LEFLLSDDPTITPASILNATSLITASFLSRNEVRIDDLPGLIQTVHDALNQVSDPQPEQSSVAASAPRKEPAVDPKESVFPDYIICLEDGRHLTTMKRHLKTSFGLTPEEYRRKWDLPNNYPMTAPNYSETRSRLAKTAGLGKRSVPPPAPIKKKGGGRKASFAKR
jgi:predicted transcriptional regulator